MKHIDPAVAARVWQRVQNSLAQPCTPASQPLPSIPVYTTPPDAWEQPPKPPRRKKMCTQPAGMMPPWLYLLALVFLLSGKNG